jgi:hypothetical protein
VDGRFLRAFTDPARVTFFGKAVYPWCLKYRVRLLAIESPMTDDSGRIPTPIELLTAIKICAEEPIGELTKDEIKLVKSLAERPGRFMTECERFQDYAHIGAWPKFWESNKKNGSSADDAGVPWPLMVVASLVKNGVEEKRAWEMPECQAIWFNAAYSAMNGSDRKILTTDEEAFMEEQERAENAAKVAPSAEVKTPPPHVPET